VLAANVFGLFCLQPELLSLPIELATSKRCSSLVLEERLRFPWRGGRHPNLDAVAHTASEILAFECKRLEPFDYHEAPFFDETYWRSVWGENMQRFQQIRDRLHNGGYRPKHLDARQLVKHALGLRTQAEKHGKKPRLLYVYLSPLAESIATKKAQALHQREVREFAEHVIGDDVQFEATTYGSLLEHWRQSSLATLSDHAQRVIERFGL
jgi:hypothetical protein